MKKGKLFEFKLLILSIVFLSISDISCVRQKDNSAKVSTDSIASGQIDKSKYASVYYRFPTPDELFGFISAENLKYDNSVVNPATNVDKYLTTNDQTLNLGIYVSDLAYITLFEAYSKSIEYYTNVHRLSEKISIASAYNLEVAKRIEKNLLNVDSLKKISVDSYTSMVEFLIVNNREKTLALIAAGAYVECFYISFNVAGKYSDNNPMVKKISDLKYAFENLYSYLQIYSDDADVKKVADKFKKLNDLFAQISISSNQKTTVTQNSNGDLVLGGGSQLKLEKPLYENLKKEIAALRAEIINAK